MKHLIYEMSCHSGAQAHVGLMETIYGSLRTTLPFDRWQDSSGVQSWEMLKVAIYGAIALLNLPIIKLHRRPLGIQLWDAVKSSGADAFGTAKRQFCRLRAVVLGLLSRVGKQQGMPGPSPKHQIVRFGPPEKGSSTGDFFFKYPAMGSNHEKTRIFPIDGYLHHYRAAFPGEKPLNSANTASAVP